MITKYKLFERIKYLKPFQKIGNKFMQGDFVTLTSDYVNGFPKENISKQVFEIKHILKEKDHRAITNRFYFLYLLQYLNDEAFTWVKEDTLKLANDEDVKKEHEKVQMERDAKRYNL